MLHSLELLIYSKEDACHVRPEAMREGMSEESGWVKSG